MLASTSLHVPPGQYPPFAAVTETDHSAWIIIAAAFGLSMILLAGGIRVFIRLTISRGWGVDDTLFAVSNVSCNLEILALVSILNHMCRL